MQEQWTEKYRPRSLKDIVGNEMAIRTMSRWADTWKVGVPRTKALVLRGEPGTGKTSAALALANDMGWDFIEMNASDHRNAESIKSIAGAGSANQTFAATGEFLSSDRGKRKLIILDEADNLVGHEDRGGAKAIVDTIRESGQPIILIVNDYYELTRKSPAIKTLAEKAVFKRLSSVDVCNVLRSIVEQENFQAPAEVLDSITENSAGDLRAAINDLQMIFEGRTELVATDSGALGKRNQEKELETALRTMFRARSVRGARDATFDLDKTPDELVMWIEENVPQEMRGPKELSDAFDAISRSDIYLGRTRSLQHYGLWSYAKELMTGGVALARAESSSPGPREYRFPSQFIVMSRARGPRAVRDSIAGKVATYIHTSRRCVKESTLPLLSVLARRDKELLVELGMKMDLDESDVSYLLDAAPDSSRVLEAMHRIRQDASGAGDANRSGRAAGHSRSKKNLTEF